MSAIRVESDTVHKPLYFYVLLGCFVLLRLYFCFSFYSTHLQMSAHGVILWSMPVHGFRVWLWLVSAVRWGELYSTQKLFCKMAGPLCYMSWSSNHQGKTIATEAWDKILTEEENAFYSSLSPIIHWECLSPFTFNIPL